MALGGSRARRRGLGVVLAAVLGFSVTAAPASAFAAPDPVPTDEAAASAAARAQGRPVLVESLTSEVSEVRANPDGSFTMTQSLEPERVRRGSGWVPVDLTLVQRPEGGIVPVATPVDVELSDGGSVGREPLAVVGKDGREVGLDWQGDLPRPVLSGDTATYPEVYPGVDLAVRVTARGFSQVLVVKTPEAAKNPALRKVTFGSHAKGVEVVVAPGQGKAQARVAATRADGLRVTDPKGELVFGGDASRMWDSTGTRSGAAGPGDAGREAAMGVEVGDGTVAVVPDADFLASADRKFPVYIDPEYWWAGNRNHHAVVQTIAPDAHNYDSTAGVLNDLKAGRVLDGQWLTSRSFIEMDTWGVRYKQVIRSQLRTRVAHSYSCGGGATELWWTDRISWHTTWNAQPWWKQLLDSTSVSNNARHCPSGGGADLDVTAAVQGASNAGDGSVTFGLRARDENDQDSWRRFDLNPTLEVVYNSYPNSPVELGMEGGLLPCVYGDGRPYVATTTPRLRGRVSDPDSDAILTDVGFAVHRGPITNSYWVAGPVAYNIPSGSFAEVTVPAEVLLEGEVYNWSMYAGDGNVRSNWAGNCEFKVDTTPPVAPAVESASYPYDQPAGGLGRTGQFELKPNGADDVQYYLYSFTEQQNDDPQTRVNANGVGGSALIQWTPSLEGPQTLFVRSVDRAGNRSEIYRYKVFVQAGASGPIAHWKLDGNLSDASGNNRPLHVFNQPDLTAPGYHMGGVSFDGVDDRIFSGKLIDTTKSFSVSAWVKLTERGRWVTMVSQDGAQVSGFFLGVSASDDRWSMTMASSDSGQAGVYRALSHNPPVANEWTHLVGTFDSATKQLTLHVNGVREGVTTAHGGGWLADGNFLVGRAKWNGQPTDFFPGAVDEVRVYDRVLQPAEAAELANQAYPRAHYALDEGSGTTTKDVVTGADATFSGNSSWSVEEFTAARFAGNAGPTIGTVRAPRPNFRTDRSYTVSAWVRLDRLDEYARTAVSPGSTDFAPFLLQYRPEHRKWNLMVLCDNRPCGWNVLSVDDAVANEWVLLTGVYDYAAKEARLYVNGRLSGRQTGVKGWNNDGELLIGRTRFSSKDVDPWRGEIDDVRIYSGVLSDEEIGRLLVRA
ncbi:concanavalin A-like lectin/glucanase superfamily protein [Saccharothrix australiensis]|uniref:Concanavalin A-like lectin/glucanase superfamily protein n=2 Tax=Saccharothrix australiensis TaxID=2072 RepID=A0A495VXQ4_9PSEU|nr:concanavalin A-like lectin/glucanase superfamily protein [Saccharothrix australiensis]